MLKDGWGSNGGLWTVPEYSISNGCGDGGNNIKVKEEVVFQGGGGEEWKLGKREASVLSYKEKRQNRLFFKGIRYEVRKINAEKRPRMKVACYIVKEVINGMASPKKNIAPKKKIKIVERKSDCLQAILSAALSTSVAHSWEFARFVNIRDKNGATQLHLAARQGWPGCVHMLLDSGALVCASSRGYGFPGIISLHFAVRGGSLDCVRELLAWGADRLHRDSSGRIPYMVALRHKHAACAALLNPSAPDPLIWPSPLKFITELNPEAKALLERALMETNKEREKTILKATVYSLPSPLHSEAAASDIMYEDALTKIKSYTDQKNILEAENQGLLLNFGSQLDQSLNGCTRPSWGQFLNNSSNWDAWRNIAILAGREWVAECGKEIVKVENKEHGKASAAASLYFHSNDNHVIAGALLGVGIVNCGIKNDCDPALALLADYIDTEDSSVRIGAIMGLGLAYAGAQNEQIRSKLTPILGDNKVPLDVIAFTAISLALVYVGSCNEEVALAIIFALMDRSESELGEPLTRLLPLGLGLLYLGKQATTEVSKTFNEKIRKYCDMTLLSCAYAGTGNVLKVQHLLGQCAQHLEKGETHQGLAILGIAMVAMAEELGLEMAIRSLEHLLQYREQNIRRAVPLALGLLCISNPKVNVMDTLNRLSHDTDTKVAMAGVISLGLIGAGTNNARIAGMLCNLSSYYYKEASLLFCVRIAQGLVHLGKGLLTLAPYHSERFLLSPKFQQWETSSKCWKRIQSDDPNKFSLQLCWVKNGVKCFMHSLLRQGTALAGIVTLLHACLDMKAIILGKYHYVLYFLVLAMQPRMLLTVDENLKPLLVPVRVGQAVDVVGQAGRPKTITGFQTHSTPVLLAAGDRAELATEKSTPLKLDLLPTEARISGKEYKERVVNNLKILIVHYSVHQSHSKAVKRAISEHCGVWTISMLSYFYYFQCIGIRCCGDAAVMVIVTMRCCGVVVGCLLVLLMFGRVQDFLSNL
ncbi:unnamed protein product [Camellia sinensis]